MRALIAIAVVCSVFWIGSASACQDPNDPDVNVYDAVTRAQSASLARLESFSVDEKKISLSFAPVETFWGPPGAKIVLDKKHYEIGSQNFPVTQSHKDALFWAGYRSNGYVSGDCRIYYGLEVGNTYLILGSDQGYGRFSFELVSESDDVYVKNILALRKGRHPFGDSETIRWHDKATIVDCKSGTALSKNRRSGKGSLYDLVPDEICSETSGKSLVVSSALVSGQPYDLIYTEFPIGIGLIWFSRFSEIPIRFLLPRRAEPVFESYSD